MVGSLTKSGNRRLAGLAIVVGVMLASALAQASTASAVNWDLNGNPTTEALSVTAKGALKVTDAHGGLFLEKVKIECAVTSKGTVGPDSADETTQWTPSECVTKEGTCPVPVVTALNLPWRTALTVIEGKTRDALSSGGSGAPGYKVTCSGAAEDKCTGNTNAATENVSGGVNTTFDAKSTALSCSRGEKSTGTIQGVLLVENPTSGTLTAVEALAEGWHLDKSPLTAPRAATSSGTLTFIGAHSGPLNETIEIECKINDKDTVGPNVAGAVASMEATGCIATAGSCPTPSVEAKNLSWETELFTLGTIKHNLLTSALGVKYTISCGGGAYTYTCSWNTSPTMTNTTEGVDAKYEAADQQTCTHGTGSIVGTELIKVAGHELSI